MTNTVFVSVGSNIDKEYNLVSCIHALNEHFGKITTSDIYESKAVGFKGDNFYNMVVSFVTDCSPQQVKEILHGVELQHKRVRGVEKFVSRTLDLDQLLYGDEIIEQEQLQLPDCEITNHTYILYPLSDIAADKIHPILKKSFTRLRDELDKNKKNTLLKKIHFSELEKQVQLHLVSQSTSPIDVDCLSRDVIRISDQK